ncbi:MAG: transposase [Thermomicrobia bacterium]|nr:transposase [Thermomicrobia bacterium]
MSTSNNRPALWAAWDNASWHLSKQVRGWIGEHNRAVKRGEARMWIVLGFLPSKSPWLSPIEPKWMQQPAEDRRTRPPADGGRDRGMGLCQFRLCS